MIKNKNFSNNYSKYCGKQSGNKWMHGMIKIIKSTDKNKIELKIIFPLVKCVQFHSYQRI